jgi:hypothetical protein
MERMDRSNAVYPILLNWGIIGIVNAKKAYTFDSNMNFN